MFLFMGIVCVPQLLYPSVDGRRGCFGVSAAGSSAAVDTGSVCLPWVWVSSG